MPRQHIIFMVIFIWIKTLEGTELQQMAHMLPMQWPHQSLSLPHQHLSEQSLLPQPRLPQPLPPQPRPDQHRAWSVLQPLPPQPPPATAVVPQLVDQHRAWSILQQFECGDSFADRIIGGIEANLGQYPWIARLGYTTVPSPTVEYRCGATLVSPRYVLTAAHCVVLETTDKLVAVRLGEHDERHERDCRLGVCAPPAQDFRAASVAAHPRFNNPPYANDIAIVELDRPAVFTDFVSPICLPRGALRAPPAAGELVAVAGWGLVNMSTQNTAATLQTLQLPVLPLTSCDEYANTVRITDAQICAGSQLDRDACGGDSGGPLMKVFETDEGPKTFLVGIVSFGPEVCGVKHPGIYTSVAHHMPWILDHMIR